MIGLRVLAIAPPKILKWITLSVFYKYVELSYPSWILKLPQKKSVHKRSNNKLEKHKYGKKYQECLEL